MSAITELVKSQTEEIEQHLASLNFYQEQCKELKQERKQLKDNIKKWEEADDYVDTADELENYLECIRDDLQEAEERVEELEEEHEKLKKENKEMKGVLPLTWLHSDDPTIEKLQKENKGLKNNITYNEEEYKINMLEAKFNTWREVMGQYDSQYGIDDEITFLNDNSDNQEYIKTFFDELYKGEYQYDIATKMYYEESDEEEDEEQKQMDEFIDKVLTTMKVCKN